MFFHICVVFLYSAIYGHMMFYYGKNWSNLFETPIIANPHPSNPSNKKTIRRPAVLVPPKLCGSRSRWIRCLFIHRKSAENSRSQAKWSQSLRTASRLIIDIAGQICGPFLFFSDAASAKKWFLIQPTIQLISNWLPISLGFPWLNRGQ